MRPPALVNSFHYLLQTGLASLLPLIAIPLITRSISPPDLGVFALAQTWGTMLAALANFGMLTGYERSYFQYEDNPEKGAAILFSVWLVASASMVTFCLLAFFWRAPLAGLILKDSHYGEIFAMVLGARCLARSADYYATLLKSSGMALQFTRLSLLEPAANFLGVMYWVVFRGLGIHGLAVAALCGAGAVSLVATFRVLRSSARRFDAPAMREILSVSLPLTPRILFGALGTNFDKIMLGFIAAFGGLGIYSIGQRIAYFVFAVMTALDRVFIPEVYRRLFGDEEARRSLARYLAPFAYASLLAALLVITFVEELFMLVIPAEYAGAVDIVIVLAVFYASLFFGKVNGPQLTQAKRTGLLSWLTLIGIVLNVIVSLPLILRYGAMGAAVGTLVAGVVGRVIGFRLAQRHNRIDWDSRRISAMYTMFAAAAGAALAARFFLPDAYSARLALRLGFLAAYLGLGVAFGWLSKTALRSLFESGVGAMRAQIGAGGS